MLIDLISQAPTINTVAWEQKANPRAKLKLLPGSQPDKTLEAPTLRGSELSADGFAGTG